MLCSPPAVHYLAALQGHSLCEARKAEERPPAIRKESFIQKSGRALEQAAREFGGVIALEGVQEMWRCGIKGHGLVVMVGTGWGWS